MSRNAAVRLSIASSVAAILMFLGLATQWAHQDAPRLATNAEMQAAVDASALSAIPVERISPDAEAEDDDTTKVRRATIEWVKTKYPDAKVEGVFMLAFGKGNLYLTGADTQFGGDKRRTVDLLVRRYSKRGGGQYFRAEGLEPEQAAALRQKADFDPDATEYSTTPVAANGWDDTGECQQ